MSLGAATAHSFSIEKARALNLRECRILREPTATVTLVGGDWQARIAFAAQHDVQRHHAGKRKFIARKRLRLHLPQAGDLRSNRGASSFQFIDYLRIPGFTLEALEPRQLRVEQRR
jgi:hypothetical protein